MAGYCANCGTEISEGAAFCPNCGRSTAQAGTRDPRGGEDGARRQTQGTLAASATQQATPPDAGQRPVVTPPVSAPSGAKKSRRGLLIGGLAAAGLLGFLALLVVGALVYFFLLGPSPRPEPMPQPTPAAQPEPAPSGQQQAPEGQQQQPAPEEGSLQERVQDQVGDFTLQEVAENPGGIEAGATEALIMGYAGPDGVVVRHTLWAMPSPEEAEATRQTVAQSNVEDGFQVLDEQPVTIEGEQVGTVTVLQGEVEGSPLTLVLWTNGNIYAGAIGSGDAPTAFYQNVPY